VPCLRTQQANLSRSIFTVSLYCWCFLIYFGLFPFPPGRGLIVLFFGLLFRCPSPSWKIFCQLPCRGAEIDIAIFIFIIWTDFVTYLIVNGKVWISSFKAFWSNSLDQGIEPRTNDFEAVALYGSSKYWVA